MEVEEELNADVSNIFKSIQSACDELTQRGQEYLLVSVDPISQSCMKIGSQKGRQFLDVNAEILINFFSFCFGAEIITDLDYEDGEDVVPGDDAAIDTSVRGSQLTEDVPDDNTAMIDTSVRGSQQTEVQVDLQATVNDSDETKIQTDEQTTVDGTNSKISVQSPGKGTNTHTDLQTAVKDTDVNNVQTQVICNDQNKIHADIQIQVKNSDEKNEQPNLQSTDQEELIHNVDGKNLQDTAEREKQKLENSERGSEQEGDLETNLTEISGPPVKDVERKQNSVSNEGSESKTVKSNETSLLSDNEDLVSTVAGVNQVEKIDSFDKIHKTCQESQNDSAKFKESLTQADQNVSDNIFKGIVKTKERIKLFEHSKKKIKSAVSRNKDPHPIFDIESSSKPTTKPKGKAIRVRTRVESTVQNDSSPSKPTCSICKATFSRIHSLKGHMLIIHQTEVSLNELQSKCENDNVNSSENIQIRNSDPEQKHQEKKTPKRKSTGKINQETPLKNQSSKSESARTEIRNSSEKKTNMTSEREFIEEITNRKDTTKNKRKNKEVERIEEKKIKLENTDTNYPENDIETLETMDLENKINSSKSDEPDTSEEAKKLKYDVNDTVVLEENHDENVPKIKNEKKKQDKQAYCDICKKFFQRQLNLTIHNIRFHPSKIMQQFGVDLSAPVPIKQEVVDSDEGEECEHEDTSLADDSQQENLRSSSQESEDMSEKFIETLLEPRERLKEIQENDQIQKYITFTNTDNKLEISCKNCSFSCNEFHQVLVHIARIHPESSADLDVMMNCFYGIRLPVKKCDECFMTFKSVASLWNHIVQTHPETMENSSMKKRLHHLIKKYKSKKSFVRCEICKEHFRSMRALDIHMVNHPEVGKRFRCPQCAQSFSTKPNLTRHFKQIHLDEKKYQCDVCGRSFKQKETLKYHRTTHEDDKPRNFECHVCHKRLRKKETLQIHLRQHEGIKPYICEFCGMTFNQNGNRNKHVQLVHNNVRHLECQKCGKGFKLQEHLKRHLKMHLIREGQIPADKTYNCEIPGCMARYATSTQLKVHTMSKHTNERPWSCETCGKGFTTKDKLFRHANTHLEGLYNCNICHKKLSSKESLNIHMAYHETSTDVGQFEDNYETVIIPQENGAPIKVQLSHSEPIITESSEQVDTGMEEGTYFIQTKSGDGEEDTIKVDDNTILVDPSVLESVLATSDEQTVYYYVT